MLDGRDVILIRLDGSRERYFHGDASRPAEFIDLDLSDQRTRYKRVPSKRFIRYYELAAER